MAVTEKARNLEQIAQVGTDLILRCIVPSLPPEDLNKFIAVDVNSGEYEVDDDDYAAVHRLRARVPGAEVWLGGTGDREMDRLGFR